MGVDRTKLTFALLPILLVISLVISAVDAHFISSNVTHSNNQYWCPTLELLTAKPVPKPSDPQANQSRETLYHYYSAFIDLEAKFGCNS